MQCDGDWVVTNSLEWALWHANLGLMDFETLFGQCFCDVVVGDRTEQTAIDTGLLQNLDNQTREFFTLFLSCSQFCCCCCFQFSTLGFKFLDSFFSCTASDTLWDQIVACIAVFNLDDVTQVAQIDDFFQQNNLHVFLQYPFV